ncbi:hypothetical protein B7494_g5502 [Chlorociboria aeruginascens]|nr:hypothetical protein B7494_g5502 [Chlorociboria aeruginascens]
MELKPPLLKHASTPNSNCSESVIRQSHLPRYTDSAFQTDNLPTIALTSSGGGLRALLAGAGVIQGFDNRDSQLCTSGLYQAFTYHAGLSGGSWLLSSFVGNNFPTISQLKESIWQTAFQDSLFVPEKLLVASAYFDVVTDIEEKNAAGFPTTLTDPWGRLLSYQLLAGDDGGAATTLSSITGLSSFTSHSIPYPLISALGVKTFLNECLPGPNATTYEFSPYEFGSWDSDVSAFTPTQYLGTTMNGGKPTGLCTKGYDNLGYVFGTSSNLFNNVCGPPPTPQNDTASINSTLAQIVAYGHELTNKDEFAVYKNPFQNYLSSTATRNLANDVLVQPSLTLADGGEANQNNPLWPLIQPARDVQAIIVNDNSADTAYNWPNGSEIQATYIQSLNHGLTRMPFIPDVDVFLSQGLNSKPTFFGCGDMTKITIILLPNTQFSFASNTSTFKLEYTKEETDAMIANGAQVASQNEKSGWATCLGSKDYEYKGRYETIGGLKTYVTGPATAKTAILHLYDAFGYFPQTIQGADILASSDKDHTYQVFMPDFFEGHPCDIAWYPPVTEEQHRLIGEWFSPRMPATGADKIPKILGDIEEKYGQKTWGVVGFCWGGKVVSMTSGLGTPFKVGAQCHPGMIDKVEAARVTIPTCILVSQDEPADAVAAYEEALTVEKHVETFGDQIHGWMTARGDLENERTLSHCDLWRNDDWATSI